ncbi:serine hydrolase domain-containing protein [Maribellus maritimus]|uniref:serine hydrolase domain-containing protein n=1 Tax=Maribellus maritimus TaxID=2870838 RepID=UPI001EEC443B|nr:serine hydrolase [Maribellus maritimus]MCG6191426.1 beta-lactamase family protein [Maribellus maritimus]
MKTRIQFILLISILVTCSCDNKLGKITGYWEVTYTDSISYTKQILHFEKDRGTLKLTIDEPLDGTLGVPGEKPFFANDSLHFESMWGLFKYDGKFVSGDSLIHGIRVVNDGYPTPFVMRSISEKKLLYKIPRVNFNGERIYNYSYHKPLQKDDGLECSTLSEAGIDSTYIYKLIENILKGKMATIHSLLIVKDNKLVLEEYFHNYDNNKLHSLESVTKSFTSSLIGIAIDKKFIPDVNEPVWHYFEKWDSTQWFKKKYDIKIKNLLTMTAGLDWKPFTPNKFNDDVNIYTSPDWIKYILNKDLKDKPGDKFFYNNRLMFLQGHIIEESSGLSVDSFATKYLFNELGIKYHKWEVYDNGITETGGGLKLLPRDMMKFGLMYLNHGEWQGKQVISPEWIKSSTENQVHSNNQEYGYNWWIKSYNINQQTFNTYYALGHGEQLIMAIPNANTVFVMTAGNYFQTPQRQDEIMRDYILPSLTTNNEKTQSSTEISMRDVVGEYEINAEETIKIEIADNTLVAIEPSGERFKLLPKSSGFYLVENSPREVRFIYDETKTIVAAEIFVNGENVERLNKTKKFYRSR